MFFSGFVAILFAAASALGAATPSAVAELPDTGSTVRTADPSVEALRTQLERLVSGTGWRGDQWSILVVSLDRNDTLYARAAHQPLAPASNVKLFTSAAALYYLGPSFRYSTYLLTGGRIEGEVLRGDLILYGTGDPTISDRFHETKLSVWEEFADSLLAQGIRRIEGEVVGDASYFGGPSTGEGWREDYKNAWYAAPASALSFNDNIVTLRVRPGAQAGYRPRVDMVPGGEGISIVNQATTIARGRSWIDVDRAAYDGPIVVRGRISRGHSGIWRLVPVSNPARYSAAMLHSVLADRGIEVTGGIRAVATAAESPVTGRSVFAPAFEGGAPLRVLAVHKSPPLQEILEIVNKKSHNLYAELVLRTVGRVAVGDGTVEGGARAVEHLLQRETGVVDPDFAMYDGSGLSVLNRSSAATIVQLLDYMASSPMWEAYWATLPEAGNPRGLPRMYRTAAERNLRAKTGTIDNVSALSGYVRARNGENLAFSIISNRVPSTFRAKRIEDAIGARIAAFDRPPGGARVEVPLVLGAEPAEIGAEATAEVAADADAGEYGEPEDDARPHTHVIRKGDTLDAIAREYGTTVRALQAANPGLNPRRLLPGRSVILP